MAEEVFLNWQGPYLATDDALFECGYPGLYMFLVPVGQELWINYLGKTNRSIAVRLVEHFRATVSGQYYLYEPTDLLAGKKTTVYNLADDYKRFFQSLPSLLDLAQRNLEVTRIMVCKIPERADVLESLFLYHFLKDGGAVRRERYPLLDNADRIPSIAYESDLTVRNTLPPDVSIKGFPDILSPPAP